MECKEGGFIFQRCGQGGCGLVVAAGGWSCSSGRGSLRVAPHRAVAAPMPTPIAALSRSQPRGEGRSARQ